MRYFRSWNFTRLSAYALFGTSVCIVLAVVYYVSNIQVISNWKLTIPSTVGTIHVGDTFVVDSVYTKLRQVTGTSKRSLECQSSPGVFVSYPLNSVSANRAPGHSGTGVIVSLTNLRGLPPLPAPCRVCVALGYPILPGRTVPYFKCTSLFFLQPASVASSASSPIPKTSPAQAQAVSSPSETIDNTSTTSSFTQNTIAPPPAQPDSSQSPSFVDELLQPARGLVQLATNTLL